MAAKAGWPRLFTTLVDCPHCGARIDFDAATHTASLGENRSLLFFVCTACDRKFRIDSEAERDAALLVLAGSCGAMAIAWFLPSPWRVGLIVLALLWFAFSHKKVRQWVIRPRP
jgi:DNA-directed RNA polymerase subunit RPC12/RpoP